MKIVRYLCILGLWLAVAPSAWADDPTPQVSAIPPVVTEPTVPPVVDTIPATAAPPVVDSSPLAPAKERSQPVPNVPESGVPATVVPTAVPRFETGPSAPGVTLNPNIPLSTPVPTAAGSRAVGPVAGPPQLYSAPAPSEVSAITSPYAAVSAQAPAQLSCTGKRHPTALPFLVSPYAGWTELVSFLDHDSPDYTVDGSIVLANGMSATAGDGQQSDAFPAYWSPGLRQFVNYDGHNGYDLALSYQPVLAAGSGTVTFAGWNSSDAYAGYGQMVLIDHHNGYVTLYGHLSQLAVSPGDKVTAGQEIGISGTTGNSSGPHLHFSVFHNCHVTDPYGWTGQGTDPLYTFDGEHASYLWLPGRDPLIVNPPRDWPTFPLGLRLSVANSVSGKALVAHLSPSKVPPVDRLLLLDLPESHSVGTSSPAVALVRTEASITQEAEALAPALDDLESQGLIQRYQVIPAAAAVWLRGTASATQLLSLPGVASLAGVQAYDLSAAQAGLSHDVLIQMRHQQAPSLWPLGFRSALHAWRPMMTVVNQHALVTGLALPGQRVALTLTRSGGLTGEAEASADVNTGGFVAMLHDVSGNPVVARPGDVITVDCGGKTDKVTVIPLSLKARSHSVSGQTSPGASIPISLTRVGGSVLDETVAGTTQSGTFRLTSSSFAGRGSLDVGELAVGTITDSGGDQEAASAFVPGAQIYEGSALVRGWTVGSSPRIAVARGGHTVLTRRIRSAPDGTFQLELRKHGRLFPLVAGDVVRIGSRWHPRAVTVPPLHVELKSGTRTMTLVGPANATAELVVTRSDGHSSARVVRLGAHGHESITVAGSVLALGDTARLQFVSSSGDQIYAQGQARGILIAEGSGTVSGTVRAGAVLSIHVLAADGTQRAGAVATADPATGNFSARLHTTRGHALRLTPGMQILVRDGALTTTTTIPTLDVTHVGHVIVSLATTDTRHPADWTAIDAQGRTTVRLLKANVRGVVRDRYSLSSAPSKLSRITVSLALGGGVSIERVLNLERRTTVPATSTPTKRTARCAGPSTILHHVSHVKAACVPSVKR